MGGRRRKQAVFGVGALVAAYLVYPYYTLYRLGDAIRRGDSSSLEALVDWDQVREGIKEDICDQVFDDPASASPSGQASNGQETLPPFGFSFMRGIAGNAIDKSVTAAGLVVATRSAGIEGAPLNDPRANPTVGWAFFESPTRFRLDLLPPGEAASAGPIRIEMQMLDGRWKVTRAWLPTAMLTQSNSRT